jgi:hypothetical protein
VVLTAAHCLPLYATDRIVGGLANRFNLNSTGSTSYKPLFDSVCPIYPNSGEMVGDVGLIFLDKCVEPTAEIRPIKVATRAEWLASRTNPLLISGWGSTSEDSNSEGQEGRDPDVLQYGRVKWVDAGRCNSALRKQFWNMDPKYEFW